MLFLKAILKPPPIFLVASIPRRPPSQSIGDLFSQEDLWHVTCLQYQNPLANHWTGKQHASHLCLWHSSTKPSSWKSLLLYAQVLEQSSQDKLHISRAIKEAMALIVYWKELQQHHSHFSLYFQLLVSVLFDWVILVKLALSAQKSLTLPIKWRPPTPL